MSVGVWVWMCAQELQVPLKSRRESESLEQELEAVRCELSV